MIALVLAEHTAALAGSVRRVHIPTSAVLPVLVATLPNVLPGVRFALAVGRVDIRRDALSSFYASHLL